MQVELKEARSAAGERVRGEFWVWSSDWVKIREKLGAVEGLMERLRRAGGTTFTMEQGLEMVNTMGKWSELAIGKTSSTEVVRPNDKTRSKVWPLS